MGYINTPSIFLVRISHIIQQEKGDRFFRRLTTTPYEKNLIHIDCGKPVLFEVCQKTISSKFFYSTAAEEKTMIMANFNWFPWTWSPLKAKYRGLIVLGLSRSCLDPIRTIKVTTKPQY